MNVVLYKYIVHITFCYTWFGSVRIDSVCDSNYIKEQQVNRKVVNTFAVKHRLVLRN